MGAFWAPLETVERCRARKMHENHLSFQRRKEKMLFHVGVTSKTGREVRMDARRIMFGDRTNMISAHSWVPFRPL